MSPNQREGGEIEIEREERERERKKERKRERQGERGKERETTVPLSDERPIFAYARRGVSKETPINAEL